MSEVDTHSVLIFENKEGKKEPVKVDRIGGFGKKPGELVNPSGIAFDPFNPRIFVSDAKNHRIQIFEMNKDDEFNFVKSFGKHGDKPGEWFEPSALRFDMMGNLYVCDIHNGRIQKYSSGGEFITQFGDGKLIKPIDFHIDNEGSFYVVDQAQHKVFVFDHSGEYKFSFGGSGPAKGQFILPFGVTTDENNVFISDTSANRIKVFDKFGNYQREWGAWGTGPGEFYKPKGIILDANGKIVVMDFGNHRGQMFARNGVFETMFGIGDKYSGQQAPITKSKFKTGTY